MLRGEAVLDRDAHDAVPLGEVDELGRAEEAGAEHHAAAVDGQHGGAGSGWGRGAHDRDLDVGGARRAGDRPVLEGHGPALGLHRDRRDDRREVRAVGEDRVGAQRDDLDEVEERREPSTSSGS
jgi:hypothetical protein